MTDDRDPGLQALFDAAPRAAASREFVDRAMAGIDSQRHRIVFGWVAAAALALPVIWWLSGPVVTTLNLAARLMPQSLVEVEADWLGQVIAPVNSVTGVAGLLFLAVWLFYRKFIR